MVEDSSRDEGPPSEETDVDSLFDGNSPTREDGFPFYISGSMSVVPTTTIAQCSAPSIPGLFFDPSVLISPSMESELRDVAARYFGGASAGPATINQVMFFGRASGASSGLPSFLDDLVIALRGLLKPHLPKDIHAMLFPAVPSASRQAILNYYLPGEGITPHVDLLTRFADGIVAVSLGSGTVMTFRRVRDGETNEEGERIDVYLPERSVLVITGDARYKWSHGIEGRFEDRIEIDGEEVRLRRGARTSITLRWLLPGADIVGVE